MQLLVVLCIPAAALGLPFILSHPLTCIVLPLVVYFTPGLQEVVKPLLSALLQLILSGLRPSGSPKSSAFPWQQVSQHISQCFCENLQTCLIWALCCKPKLPILTTQWTFEHISLGQSDQLPVLPCQRITSELKPTSLFAM